MKLDAKAYGLARAEASKFEIDVSRTIKSLTIVRLDTVRNNLENAWGGPLGS